MFQYHVHLAQFPPPPGETTRMMDAMQQLMTGDPQYFDPDYLTKLYSCFDTLNPVMMMASVSFKI